MVVHTASTETPEKSPHGKPAAKTLQATSAEEMLALYLWWTKDFPSRVNEMKASGYIAFSKKMSAKYDKDGNRHSWHHHYDNIPVLTVEEQAEYDHVSKLTQEIADFRDAEDDAMLIRLIKIRKSLWA